VQISDPTVAECPQGDAGTGAAVRSLVVVAASEENPPAPRPRFLRSAATTFATNLGVAVVSLVNVLITARFLGPTGRGDIALLFTVAGLTATTGNLGVQQAIVNIGGREPRFRPALATNAVLLTLLLAAGVSLVLGVLLVAFPGLKGDVSAGLFAFVFAAIPVLIGRVFLQAILDSDYRFSFSNGVRLIAPVSGVLANSLLGAFGALTVTSAMTAWTVGQTASTLLLAWYVARRMEGFGRPDGALARRSLTFGTKAHASHVLGLGNWRLDQWFVGTLAGSRELGYYSVAVAWSEALFILPGALRNVQRPDLVRAARQSAGRQAARVFRICVAITLPAVLAMILIAPILCTTIFGDEFADAVDDLRWLLPGTFGIVAIRLLGDALIAQRRPLLPTIAIGIALVVTIVLDVALIPAYGGEGAAIASLVAYTVGGVAVAVLFARGLDTRPGELVPRRRDIREFLGMLRARARPTPAG
jgi:O-antigen/teichoic acid export membrane protein